MIELAHYLGKRSTVLLRDLPFRDWKVKRTVDNDSIPPIIGYVFEEHGIQFNCDRDDESIRSLFFDRIGYEGEGSSRLSFDYGYKEMHEKFGAPSKADDGFSHPILGDFGPWERFQLHDFTLHVEYRRDKGGIEKITLMRNDVMP